MSFLALDQMPWIIAALLLVGLVTLWSLRRRRQVLRRLVSQPSALRTNASPGRRRLRFAAILIALVASAIALLRPVGGTILTEQRLPAKHLMIVLDVSKSMAVPDAGQLTRIEAAKLFAREFINRRPTDRIGLLSFSGAAFPECPITLNRNMLLQRLDLQQAGGLPVGGSNLDTTVKEAAHLLTTNPPPGSAVILLSDGDRLSEDADALLELIPQQLPIHTVFTGTPDLPATLPDTDIESTADPRLLARLSEHTSALALSADPAQLETSLNQLDAHLDTMNLDGIDIAATLYSRPLELFVYPAGLVLALLFLRLFLPLRSRRWHALAPLILLGLLVLPTDLSAQEDTPPSALETKLDQALARAEAEDRPLMLLFTASDWSAATASFDQDIRSSALYTDWVARRVIQMEVDLPRSNIDAATRNQRRALAKRFQIESYPTALFLHHSARELGRLNHDPDGPAAWVRRAELILAGNTPEGDSASSIKQLPEELQAFLNDPDISSFERALRLYNQSIEFERMEPELSIDSKDRFRLLEDLLTKSIEACPEDRSDMRFAASHRRASLYHRKARSLLPRLAPSDGEAPSPGEPEVALRTFGTARQYYYKSAQFQNAHPDLQANLALLEADFRYIQAFIDFQKNYQEAVDFTSKLYQQETRFKQSFENWVTTSEPVNDQDITNATTSIERLLESAKIIEYPQTSNIVAALEDIELAPIPHDERQVPKATTHIEDALKHLLQDQQVQQQSNGEGDEEGGEDSDPSSDRDDGNGDDEGDEQQPRDHGQDDADLRDAGRRDGNLRDRLLDRLRKNNPPTAPGQDH